MIEAYELDLLRFFEKYTAGTKLLKEKLRPGSLEALGETVTQLCKLQYDKYIKNNTQASSHNLAVLQAIKAALQMVSVLLGLHSALALACSCCPIVYTLSASKIP